MSVVPERTGRVFKVTDHRTLMFYSQLNTNQCSQKEGPVLSVFLGSPLLNGTFPCLFYQ